MWSTTWRVVGVALLIGQIACSSSEEAQDPETPPTSVQTQQPEPEPEPTFVFEEDEEEVPTVETEPVEPEPEARRRADREPSTRARVRQERARERERERERRAPARGRVDLEVVSAVIATNVVDRKPEGRGNRFGSNVGQVWAWVKVRNNGDAAPITMEWRHKGKTRFSTELNIGPSKGWRTWTRKTITPKQTGDWKVEIRDPKGKTLKTLAFHIAPEVTQVEAAPSKNPQVGKTGLPPRVLR